MHDKVTLINAAQVFELPPISDGHLIRAANAIRDNALGLAKAVIRHVPESVEQQEMVNAIRSLMVDALHYNSNPEDTRAIEEAESREEEEEEGEEAAEGGWAS